MFKSKAGVYKAINSHREVVTDDVIEALLKKQSDEICKFLLNRDREMRKANKLICRDCEANFYSVAHNAAYCPACRRKRYARKRELRQITCAYPPCGRTFFTSQPDARYCSPKHRVADFRRKLELPPV